MFLHDLIVSLWGETTYQTLAVIFTFYPLWLPFVLALMFWETWMRYIQWSFFLKTPSVLLEVRLPKELTKSPLAMESVLNAFYQSGGESTYMARYWDGKTRDWFSLELVSTGGEVKFYIWTRNRTRNTIEAQIYSQYPDVEIREVEDYAKKMSFDPEQNNVFSLNYFKKFSTAYPFKTYVDYGLDKDPKDEFKVDPIAGVVEQFGAIKPQENIWLQFVIRAHKKEKHKGFFSSPDTWEKEVKAMRDKFYKEGLGERSRASTVESRVLEALERSLTKLAFDVGIRVVYIADKNVYNNTTITMLRGLFRPYDASTFHDPGKSPSFGGFNTMKYSGTDDDYPWQDYKKVRMNYKRRRMIDSYKRRMFFYAPHKEPISVLTSEEIATFYHFPGAHVATPGLSRIQSKRSNAPSNLPT